jgi:hypothetical protein
VISHYYCGKIDDESDKLRKNISSFKDLSEDQFPQPMPQMIFFDIAPPSESSILLFALCSPLPILFQSDNVPRHGEVNVLLCF